MKTRREFLRHLSVRAGGLFFLNSALSTISHGTALWEHEQPFDAPSTKKLGIALVGLGKYSTGQLGPALKDTTHCKLAGIVTGTPSKAEKWKKEYNIPDKNVYNYENFDSIKDNPDIDIVYVVLPNALHAEYVIRAAKAGKHVICEKPMAISVEECEKMIQACKEAKKQLSIGYRLHFDPHNLEMVRLGTQKVYGSVKKIESQNGMELPTGTWRATKSLGGGGPLMDLGIYCVQGAIYTIGQNPISVVASEGQKTKPEQFKDVEESISWTLEFPNNVKAGGTTSYSKKMNLLRAEAEKGWFELSPSYEYQGIDGRTSDGPMKIKNLKSQQAVQMDDFAQCVLQGTPTKVPGEMGLRDVKILMAIYEAARTGQKVPLSL